MRIVNTKLKFFWQINNISNYVYCEIEQDNSKSGLKLKIWGTNYYNNRTAPKDNYEPTAQSFWMNFRMIYHRFL